MIDFILEFLLEVILGYVCYNIGYVFLKCVTFGKYPEDYHVHAPIEDGNKYVSITGGVVIALLVWSCLIIIL